MEEQIQTIEVKKSKWWLWLIVALILIVAGIIIYSLVSGNNIIPGFGGSSIPQPPALPSG